MMAKFPIMMFSVTLVFLLQLVSSRNILEDENFLETISYSKDAESHMIHLDVMGSVLRRLAKPDSHYTNIFGFVFERAPPLNNDSIQCLGELQDFVTGLMSQELWAITMLDSFGKPGGGFLKGNTMWPGYYSECLRVEGKSTRKNSPEQHFNTQYCWMDLRIFADVVIALDEEIRNDPKAVKILKEVIRLKSGICLPASCSGEFLSTLYTNLAKLVPLFSDNQNFTRVSCIPQSRDLWKDTSAVVSLVICILILLVLIVATVYDIFFCRVEARSQFQYTLCETSESIGSKKHPFKQEIESNIREPEDIPMEDVEEEETGLIEKKENLNLLAYPPSIGRAGKFLLCFSIYKNGSKLLNLDPGKGSITALNGIRFFAMTWIISGHVFIELLNSVIDNAADLLDIRQQLWFSLLIQGPRNLDTFFILSGLLGAYVFLKMYDKCKGKVNWLYFYFHRFWRLTPSYMFILFIIHMNLSKYFGYGPFWDYENENIKKCHGNWWWNLFYINNYLPMKDICMQHSWYMGCDMQVFLISPLILFPLAKRWLKASGIITGVFMLISSIWTGGLMYYYQINLDFQGDRILDAKEQFNYDESIKIKPQARLGVFAIGALCGFLLYHSECKIKIEKRWVILGWMAAFISNLIILLGLHHTHLNVAWSALYMAFTPYIWALGLCWMIFACATDHGGIVNKILSYNVWNPLSRLTFIAYLLQMFVIRQYNQSSETMLHYSFSLQVCQSIAAIILTYIGSLIISIGLEMPITELESVILRRGK